MIRIFLLDVAAFTLLSIVSLPGTPAAADEPEVIKRLRGEMVTVFDAGMKRLRQATLVASARLSSSSEPGPRSRVWYDGKAGTIEIEFHFTNVAGEGRKLSLDRCLEKRKAATRETFNVGRIIYAVPVGFDERVRRRLGTLFVLEPVTNFKEIAATGQTLARFTYLRVVIIGENPAQTVSCRDRVAPETGGG
ncbi:MAG: hypothetical protein HQ512_16010 [Rhodospirillales bacterium]|nr:hypothetical protein [Rhodospirillales bacterium]